jgi:DNA mismatch repair protein MutL
MSSVIQLLPDHIANQIAAGEVIQRPASVVKELVENAIDAKASSITVEIKDAGKTLIRVVDNGQGMSAADARLCFVRHATSKIHTADDLFSLQTKGFRGEALASIAAISHVRLKTCQPDQELGTLIELEGSSIVKQEHCVSSVGTSFEVKNLFYNVPARRNFLKSNSVEFNHILDEFERVALPHPEITFKLLHNDQELYILPPGNKRKRAIDLFGKSTNDKLVPISEQTEIVQIEGFVDKPEYARKTRGHQYFFVNDRFFRDSYFHHAVMKAFEGMIPPKTYPGYVLFFTLNPSKIDVNVHPTKTEIKFEEDRSIYAILVSAIRQALGKYNITPTLDFEQETCFDVPYNQRNKPVREPIIQVNPAYNPFHSSTTIKERSDAIEKHGFGRQTSDTADWNSFYQIKEEETIQQPTLEIQLEEEEIKRKQFLLKHPYIITPCKSGFFVIHTSRARQRIQYDNIIGQIIHQPLHVQVLMFPFEREISKKEQTLWTQNQLIIKQLGFIGEQKNGNLVLSGVPEMIAAEQIPACIEALFHTLVTHDLHQQQDLLHATVESLISVSRNQSPISSKEEAEQLIDELFQSTDHSYTPQGKRIIKTLTFDELSNWF